MSDDATDLNLCSNELRKVEDIGQSVFQGLSRLVRFACVRRGLCKTEKKHLCIPASRSVKCVPAGDGGLAKTTFILGDPKNQTHVTDQL